MLQERNAPDMILKKICEVTPEEKRISKVEEAQNRFATDFELVTAPRSEYRWKFLYMGKYAKRIEKKITFTRHKEKYTNTNYLIIEVGHALLKLVIFTTIKINVKKINDAYEEYQRTKMRMMSKVDADKYDFKEEAKKGYTNKLSEMSRYYFPDAPKFYYDKFNEEVLAYCFTTIRDEPFFTGNDKEVFCSYEEAFDYLVNFIANYTKSFKLGVKNDD